MLTICARRAGLPVLNPTVAAVPDARCPAPGSARGGLSKCWPGGSQTQAPSHLLSKMLTWSSGHPEISPGAHVGSGEATADGAWRVCRGPKEHQGARAPLGPLTPAPVTHRRPLAFSSFASVGESRSREVDYQWAYFLGLCHSSAPSALRGDGGTPSSERRELGTSGGSLVPGAPAGVDPTGSVEADAF